ncbi:ABC transporter substrate-binding protein [Planotetraspora sp. A-T 1434]|uniref:ABC transporter substrate-binding protein n=1 Tax=Planotetraspora sp. A-T 1434 TaxID=2979219 RepID=UPI0021BF19F5|nr:extracellular solute-binding protein [Planotetraspora sp. A-T 1434]MCT9932624.1 ABC transporter substrate-binding protein [Planotetraspora sp. A-T 1434]
MTVRASAVMVMLVSVAACSAPAADKNAEKKDLPPVNPKATTLRDGFATMDRLVEAARDEGALTVVGLPRGWVNYGEIIDRFSDKYGIKVTGVSPDASSQQEIDAAGGPQGVPDVFDLSLDVAVANAKRFAPYKVTGWTDIPDRLKDPKGLWYAGYGGYMSIGFNPRKMAAPASYAALLKPGNLVALPGDPLRTASAFSGVMAASLSGGKPDAARGVDFFAQLKRAGMLTQPDRATSLLDWDYLNTARAVAAEHDKQAWQVTIPRDAVLASYYVQAINVNAPHPAAARLWEEFLLSDEGQNLYLKGYARPSRMEAMEMRGTIDKDAAGKLAPVTGTPVVLTIPEQDQAKSYLQAHWPQTVG